MLMLLECWLCLITNWIKSNEALMIPFLLCGNKYSYLVSKHDQNLKFSPGSAEILKLLSSSCH